MTQNYWILLGLLLVIMGLAIWVFYRPTESFNIGIGTSSAWGWNTGPGYGAGYGTGYGLYGVWPASDPRGPWKWYMWGRRPKKFITPYTPIPQYDYLTAAPNSNPQSNYTFTLGSAGIMVNGFPRPNLQLDIGRPYYIHSRLIDANGQVLPLVFVDANGKHLTKPIKNTTVEVFFPDLDRVYYIVPKHADWGGVVYLNKVKF